MNCLCGKELSGGLDTYGPAGNEQCWECFISKEQPEDLEVAFLDKCHRMKCLIDDIELARDDIQQSERKIEELAKELNAFFKRYPAMEKEIEGLGIGEYL